MIEIRIDLVDLNWSSDDDFILKNGDFDDTFDSVGRGFIQEITTRVKSAIGTIYTDPGLGSNLDNFEGEPNSPATGSAMQKALTRALTRDGFLGDSEFIIVPVPISETQILIRIEFIGILTGKSINSKIILNIIYDLTGKGPHIIK